MIKNARFWPRCTDGVFLKGITNENGENMGREGDLWLFFSLVRALCS